MILVFSAGFKILSLLMLMLLPIFAMVGLEDFRVFRSAVDGKYYKTIGNPGKVNGSRDFTGAAGVLTPGDISGIQAVTILDEVLGRARVDYNLRAICRPIRMDKLTMRIDVATGLTGHEKVPPMKEAEISSDAYTPVNFDLWKNVVHVVSVDEAQMKAAHDVLGMSIDDAARDLPRMENKQISEIVEACTEKVSGTVYADWGLKTTPPLSDTDPMIAIVASIDAIQAKGWPVDFMAMHPTLWGKFILNSYVATLVHSGIMQIGRDGGVFTLPGYPRVKIYTDYALTETPTSALGPIVGSSRAPGLVLGQGPKTAARYRDEGKGMDAFIIRDWLEPKIVIDTALDKICT